jgi:putative FmdB family regulatory protein
MPIFDYRCRQCGHEFEAIVRAAQPATCPSCRGTDLEQLISLFSVSSASTRQTALKKAREQHQKGKKDQAIAHQEAVHKHDDDH